MGRWARPRLAVGVLAAAALALVVLFPPWMVFLVTPSGAVPLRVEFSFLFGGGPKRSLGGMYAQRSMVKADWLAFEIAGVVVVGGLLLLLMSKEAGRRERARPMKPSGAAGQARGTGQGIERNPEFQSSPGESFEQHAARLARVWRTPVPDEVRHETPDAVEPERPTPPTPEPRTAPDDEDLEPQTEYQSSPGEPFDQHAERLKRVWRPRGSGGSRKEREGEG